LVHPLAAFLPPGFDKQDIGYWVPAQFEPCVALIGSSLPSLRYYFRDGSGNSTNGSRSSGRPTGKEKKHYIDIASNSTASVKRSSNRDVESGLDMVDVDLELQPTPTTSPSPAQQVRAESNLSDSSSTSKKKGWHRFNPLNTSEQSLEERRQE